jgi:hypothetical protein
MLWTRWWTFRLRKRREISWLFERTNSREGICFMLLVRKVMLVRLQEMAGTNNMNPESLEPASFFLSLRWWWSHCDIRNVAALVTVCTKGKALLATLVLHTDFFLLYKHSNNFTETSIRILYEILISVSCAVVYLYYFVASGNTLWCLHDFCRLFAECRPV